MTQQIIDKLSEIQRSLDNQENKLVALQDIQSKMFYGLLGVIGATLGVRLTETDIVDELLYAANICLLTVIIWTFLLWFTQHKHWPKGYALILIGLTIMALFVLLIGERQSDEVTIAIRFLFALGIFGIAANGNRFQN